MRRVRIGTPRSGKPRARRITDLTCSVTGGAWTNRACGLPHRGSFEYELDAMPDAIPASWELSEIWSTCVLAVRCKARGFLDFSSDADMHACATAKMGDGGDAAGGGVAPRGRITQ